MVDFACLLYLQIDESPESNADASNAGGFGMEQFFNRGTGPRHPFHACLEASDGGDMLKAS